MRCARRGFYVAGLLRLLKERWFAGVFESDVVLQRICFAQMMTDEEQLRIAKCSTVVIFELLKHQLSIVQSVFSEQLRSLFRSARSEGTGC